ncbi:MAG: ATP-binding protein [Sulfuricurvum sp.]|nr:ATP-binding protein [Sulfuricurvum sp.]
MTVSEPSIVISEDLHRHTKELHVLYVENSDTVRHTTSKILAKYFVHINTAMDGEEGLHLFKQFHDENDRNYDIVITCMKMPNIDGIAFCKSIFDFDPNQKIIVISSCNETSSLIELINLGIDKFISKPIEPQQLHDIIYDVAHRIYTNKLKEEDYTETESYNKLLKIREKNHLNKLETNLKTLEEFNDALNESGIVSKTDPNGYIIYVNEKFCNITGYTRQEIIGQKHSILKNDDMIPSFFEKLWNTITNKKSYRSIFKNKSKNGDIYYIEQLIKPIINMDGEITEFIAIATDITQIMHSMEQAKQAEQAKNSFFRNISHEMRTPLNSIIGFTSLLKEGLHEDQESMQMLHLIAKNSQNLHQLIESVLELQNIQCNNLQLSQKEFELLTFIKKSLLDYQNAANEKGIALEYTIDSNSPLTLIGDSNQLDHAVKAILDNAIKFTPQGGKVNFFASYDHHKQLLILQIQDNGIGIALEDQAKIFELMQVDGSLSRKHEGMGLGLTIAHAIIKKMKGSIAVHSSPNQGSTFVMKIPLAHL